MQNKKVLVTGGAGFIGSNLVEELHKTNEMVVLDNLSTGKIENLDGLKHTFIEGSIADLDTVKEAMKGIDYVFHLGALPSVPRSVRDPVTSNEMNINGTLNILVAAKDEGVKKVVLASSSSVYGDTPTLPKIETMMPDPLSPYAVTKLTGEYYCSVFYKVYGLRTTAVRYFNVFGPRQDPDSEYAAVIPKFISMIEAGQSPTVFGDGEQTRDFTYVKDTAKGTILAALSEKADGQVVNVAGGKRISLNELIRLMAQYMEKDVKPTYADTREGDVKHSLADISKAEELMGYRPDYEMEDGLKETIVHLCRTDNG
ncbi:MAG: SDR family oxidoreductase [Thermoplasmata archaeon]|nr:SDR family oxidoreductase [Thermoplasmata archaeon]